MGPSHPGDAHVRRSSADLYRVHHEGPERQPGHRGEGVQRPGSGLAPTEEPLHQPEARPVQRQNRQLQVPLRHLHQRLRVRRQEEEAVSCVFE